MPKNSENKENDNKRRKRSLNPGKSRPNDASETSVKRTKTIPKQNVEDAISKSKQLSVKLKRTERTTRSSNRRNEPKICGNGKPMPPLAILEKMFEDSDSENEQSLTNLCPTKPCRTPVNEIPIVSKDIELSPTTVDDITARLIDKITNISNPSEIFDVLPPGPVVPQKKVKKSDTPYIVGCKDRPQVVKKFNTSFCKGGDEYGINHNETNIDENLPKKYKRRTKKKIVSNSLFKAQSEEIANKFQMNDESQASTSSSETITYDHGNSINNKPRAFSPLPSTSKDKDTIMKNEKLFSESMSSDSSCNSTNNNCQKNTEIIDISNSEITLNEDEVGRFKPTPPGEDKKKHEEKGRDANTSLKDVEIIEIPYDTIVLDDICDSPMTIPYDDDSCVQIAPVKQKKIEENSIIDVDDYYSSLNMNGDCQPYTDDVEIIDIDNLMEENNAILKKLNNTVDKVTVVEPSCLRNSKDDHVIEISSENAVNSVLTAANSTIDSNQQSSDSHSNKTREINNTSNLVVETPKGNNSNTQHNYLNNNIPTTIPEVQSIQHDPCPVLTEENLRIHNSLQQRNNDSIKRIVSNFFNKHKNVSINANMESRMEIPEDIYNIFANMQRIFRGLNNNDQSHLGTANTNNNNKSINVPSTQPQIPSKPSAPSKSPPQKNFGDCPICMDSLFKNTIASTTCGHLFCMECIKAALRSNGKRCPTCRTVLKGKSYHQIFI